MKAEVGDRIVVESEKAAQPSRSGIIEEILDRDPPRFRMRCRQGSDHVGKHVTGQFAGLRGQFEGSLAVSQIPQ